MKYFGVASCPYCKKRVNLLRTWSLKRQGEYQCPRCNGISNIFLSPLIYVFALLAVFSGGAVYFFHKFILDDISLSTVWQVLLPFAVFFLLSLFMVNLEKPVIKKMTKAEIARKQRKERNQEQRRAGQSPVPAGVSPQKASQAKQVSPARKTQMFYDSEEYLPQREYHTGTLPVSGGDLDKTSVVEVPKEQLGTRQQAPVQRSAPVQRPAPIQRPAPVQRTSAQRTAVQRPAPAQRAVSQSSVAAGNQAVQPQAAAAQSQVVYPSGHTAVRSTVQPEHTVTHVDVPGTGTEDFFAKYDDPDYVNRRLREIQQGQKND